MDTMATTKADRERALAARVALATGKTIAEASAELDGRGYRLAPALAVSLWLTKRDAGEKCGWSASSAL